MACQQTTLKPIAGTQLQPLSKAPGRATLENTFNLTRAKTVQIRSPVRFDPQWASYPIIKGR